MPQDSYIEMNKTLPLLFFLLCSNIFASENKTNLNLSIGQSSFIIFNASKDKWSGDRLKLGLEGNIINRDIASVIQNVLDVKVYTGWALLQKDDINLDLRIGYGINLGYYPSNNTSAICYAPIIGANLLFNLTPKWLLNCKLMGSFFQDGLAVPYLIGVRKNKLFLGSQGVFGLNIGTQITSNFETGLCVGLSW